MRLDFSAENAVYAAVATIFAAGWWVVRNVLGNNKRIALLEQSLENSVRHRERDHELLVHIVDAIQETKRTIDDMQHKRR